MKGKISWKLTAFVLILAFCLLLSGILLGVWVYRDFEVVMVDVGYVEAVVDSIKVLTLYSMISGSLMISGIGMLVILCMHILRRTGRIQREADALREKNQAMEALNRQTQKLAHHQRLEIIGTLTSSIAHEFNNLLTPIMGYSMMALEQLPDDGELYDELLEIYSASCKAKEIISRLSDLSRKNTETTFRSAAPDELIRKMVRVAEPARADNVQINMNLNCWDQRIIANEIQVSQMILNLILNGFHAMEPAGGTLSITTEFDETYIHIRITDTGCGIPGDLLNKIFEPFFTTKETGKGTGLGLAIVAQVVEDHKGRICVESKEGNGSQFTVSIPRDHDTT